MNIELIKQKAGIIGESEGINQVLEMVAQVANVDISVLINGESGTGKELVSKALHLGSKRASSDLVIVNCGAIPEGIIESELFGHKKGAYTDASDSRKGYFETANKGTIFLDEIGDMPLETQVKVLRVLESGEFMRVGDSVTKKTDVRVLAATNKDLGKLVKEGKFRQDLYYRLKTVTVNIPPLRKRKNDIRLLVDRFALQFSRSNNIKYKGFTPESIKEMHKHHWPGNVRELRNFVESILILQKGERITAEMVSNQLAGDMIDNNHSNDSLPVVIASDQGAVPVSLTSVNSGSEGNLDFATSVLSGDFSSEVDTSSAKNITITGVTTDTSSNPIELWVAHVTAGTKYRFSYDIYPDSSGNFSQVLENVAIEYFYLKYTVAATVTATALSN